MSRKKAQPAGLSWKPSSLWNSEMRTSLSVVPMQLNFCMSSASTSMSVPSMGWRGCPVAETGGGAGVLSQFSPRPRPAITTSSTTTSASAHGTTAGTMSDVAASPRVTFANHVVGVDVICCYLQPPSHWFINESTYRPRLMLDTIIFLFIYIELCNTDIALWELHYRSRLYFSYI